MTSDEKRVSDSRLREIIDGCEGVTPGPWAHGYWSGQCHKNHAHNGPRGADPCVYDYSISEGSNGVAARSQHVEVIGSDYDGLAAKPADLAHVARLDPQTVAAICSELLSRRSHPSGYREVKMGFYRKKPVVIEAIQFNPHEGLPMASAPSWFAKAMLDGTVYYQGGQKPYLTIKTLEGDHRADVGDWIIRGVVGELYPCKSHIFEATYEPAEKP